MTDEPEERHHTDAEYDALEQGLTQAIENLEHERDELKAKLDNVRNEAYSSGWNDGTRFMAKQIEHVEVELEETKAKLDELNERCLSECAEPCMAYLRAELERLQKQSKDGERQ